jgi:hypothetical protein
MVSMGAANLTLTREQYLADPDVAGFVRFFREYLHTTKYAHSYFHYDSGKQWGCISLADAAAKYEWRIKEAFRRQLGLAANLRMPDDFHSNAIVLSTLQKQLREAYGNGDAAQLEKVGQEIFVWGGTLNSNPRRLAELNAQRGGLKAYLTFCYIAFGAGEALNLTVFRDRRLVSNAGFTKIYSLQFSDFIIYDSRVAAALSLFVLLYCAARGKSAVPASLSFPCMPPQTYQRKNGPPRQPLRRNASARSAAGCIWDFPSCNNSHERHIHANLKANWVLGSATADDPNPKQNQFIASYGLGALRALEAALFMIGYDLENAVLPQGFSWR